LLFKSLRGRNEGFLDVASIKLPNTNPIPTPAPATNEGLSHIKIT